MASTSIKIPVLLRPRERRQAERFEATMPVSVDGRATTTHDLSSSGLSFLSDRPYEPGTRVDVVIEYLLDGHQYPLHCQAEVVRVEATEDGYRVGARLTPESRIREIPVGPEGTAQAPRRLRSV